MAKKLLAFLLTFALLLSSVTTAAVFTASAEVNAWDSSIATAFAGGSGTKADPYKISNGAELAYLYTSVQTTGSSFSNGKYFKLTADIYLNDVTKSDWKTNATPWYAADYSNGKRFTGNFDGNGKTVYGMYYSGDANYVSLLPVMDTWSYDIVVKNLTISDSYVSTSGDYVAAVASMLYNTNSRTAHFYNINIKDSVKIESTKADAVYVGGILGHSSCNTTSYHQFSGCAVLADVSSGHALIGYGTTSTVGKIDQCYTTCADWYPTNSKTSATAYIISDASAIKGSEAAKAAMPGLDWLRIWNCSATGYPYPMTYNTNNVAGRVWNGFLSATYASGSGTAADPYIIETAEQLARMVKFSSRENGYYKIVNDIYLNDVSNADWATNSPNKWFDRADINSKAFMGTVDGTGHTVYGLYYNGGSIFGLFPQVSETSIANLRISNANITSTSAIAALVGFGQVKVSFSKCMVDETVNITGSGDTAGFIAYGTPAIYIDSCAGTANITGGSNVASLIGDCWYGTNTAANGSTVYTKHVINNSYGVGYRLDAKLDYEASNSYTTVDETRAFTTGEVVKISADAMKGADALKNMPELDFFGTTESYPVIYQQGTKGAVWSGSVAADYEAGSGTKANPYIIATSEQLVKLVKDANTSGKYYEIVADIKLNDTVAEDWTDDAKQWFAYNSSSEFPGTFAGTLNGAGNTISGLYYNGDKFYVGLFVSSKGATYNNIIVKDSVLTSSNTGGSVAVFTGYVGGAITYNNCYIDETVSLSGAHVSGYGSYGSGNITINNCVSVADVSGTKYTASFLADVWSSTLKINNSFGVAVFSPRRSYTGSNNYGTVEDAYGVNVVTVDQMKGVNALNNMPKLTGYYATVSYPTRYTNGTVGTAWTGGIASTFASGTGTQADPYVIETAEQFARMISVSSADTYFVLGADIVLSDENKAVNWLDSSNSVTFKGSIDGNGYIISGLKYDATATGGNYVALIPSASDAYISNIILEDSSINVVTNSADATYVGGIVGYNTGKVRIYSCYVAEDVALSNTLDANSAAKKNCIGGILGGGSTGFEIDGCSFFGTIEGTDYRYGAVFGDVWGGTSSDKVVKNTMVDKYIPSSRWGFKGSHNVSAVGVGTTDESGSFTVLESVKGAEAVKIANWNDRYFATENYPVLSSLGARFNDVNGDRECNANDLTALRRKLLGISELGFADINGDGAKNVKDLVALKKKCTELVPVYKLVWSDEFNGDSLDETKWNTAQTRMADTKELAQSNLGSVRSVADGKLQLNAMVNPYYNASSDKYFEQHKYMTTGSITTEQRMSYQYGYLEVSARLPYKEGCWPSLWLRSHNATNKNTDANFEIEVDVFEVFGSKNIMAANLHQQNYNGNSGESYQTSVAEKCTFADASNLSNEYHTYGFEWTPTKMAIYVDGELQCEWLLDEESLESYGLKADTTGFDTTLNILINNHLFTSSSSYKTDKNNIIEKYESNLPAEYDIEYVRLYQKNDGLSKLIIG